MPLVFNNFQTDAIVTDVVPEPTPAAAGRPPPNHRCRPGTRRRWRIPLRGFASPHSTTSSNRADNKRRVSWSLSPPVTRARLDRKYSSVSGARAPYPVSGSQVLPGIFRRGFVPPDRPRRQVGRARRVWQHVDKCGVAVLPDLLCFGGGDRACAREGGGRRRTIVLGPVSLRFGYALARHGRQAPARVRRAQARRAATRSPSWLLHNGVFGDRLIPFIEQRNAIAQEEFVDFGLVRLDQPVEFTLPILV